MEAAGATIAVAVTAKHGHAATDVKTRKVNVGTPSIEPATQKIQGVATTTAMSMWCHHTLHGQQPPQHGHALSAARQQPLPQQRRARAQPSCARPQGRRQPHAR